MCVHYVCVQSRLGHAHTEGVLYVRPHLGHAHTDGVCVLQYGGGGHPEVHSSVHQARPVHVNRQAVLVRYRAHLNSRGNQILQWVHTLG